MTHPTELQISAPSDDQVYASIKGAFPDKIDKQIVAELARMIIFVAVCYNDVVEDGQSPTEIFERQIFVDCDELAGFFPWPDH